MNRMPTQWLAVRPQGGQLNIEVCNQASCEGSEVCEATRGSMPFRVELDLNTHAA
jgi:hypothetical protein